MTGTNRISRRRALGAGAAGLGLMAAPSILTAQPAALRIGVLLPRSGFFAQAGQSMHRGAQVAPRVLADLGMRVELVHIDTESNADIARTQAERAINDATAQGAFIAAHRVKGQLLVTVGRISEAREGWSLAAKRFADSDNTAIRDEVAKVRQLLAS